MIIHDIISSDFENFTSKIYHERVLRVLSSLLAEKQIQALYEWPSSNGGGTLCVHLISAQLLRIFNLTFSNVNKEDEVNRIVKDLNNSDIILSCISTVKYLQKEHIGIALSLLSHLIMSNDSNAGGNAANAED